MNHGYTHSNFKFNCQYIFNKQNTASWNTVSMSAMTFSYQSLSKDKNINFLVAQHQVSCHFIFAQVPVEARAGPVRSHTLYSPCNYQTGDLLWTSVPHHILRCDMMTASNLAIPHLQWTWVPWGKEYGLSGEVAPPEVTQVTMSTQVIVRESLERRSQRVASTPSAEWHIQHHLSLSSLHLCPAPQKITPGAVRRSHKWRLSAVDTSQG